MDHSDLVSDLIQSEIDVIIRAKQKACRPKTCYPCHMRKVKCDHKLPCDGCVKRDHPVLCSYERPWKNWTVADLAPALSTDGSTGRMSIDGGTSEGVGLLFGRPMRLKQEPRLNSHAIPVKNGGHITIMRENYENVRLRLKEMEQTLTNLRTDLGTANEGLTLLLETGSLRNCASSSKFGGQSREQEGIHAQIMLGEGTVYFGSQSTLAHLLYNKSGADQLQALLKGNILHILGLHNETATYPFVNLWSSHMSYNISAVCLTLPTDQECKRLITYYRDIAGTVHPIIEDIPQFGRNLDLLLHNRAATRGIYNADSDQAQRPFGMSIAYLGLLFAVLASGCQSSDSPGQEIKLASQVYVCCSYQCLRLTNFLSQPIIQCHVINNMNSNISYVLLGLTIRMSLTLGLHAKSSRLPAVERFRRLHAWWAMAWQDSFPEIPRREGSKAGNLSYFETLCRLTSLVLDVVRSRMISPCSKLNCEAIQTYKKQIQNIIIEACPYLRDCNPSITSIEGLQHAVLKLYSSYFRATSDFHDQKTTRIRAECIEYLMLTIEVYLEIHAVDSYASRSYMALQCTLSSIFLLAMTEESNSKPRFLILLRNLKIVVSEHANTESYYNPSTNNSHAPDSMKTAPTPSADGSHYLRTKPGVKITPTTLTSAAALNSPPSTADVADSQMRSAEPLTKTLRALEKLEAAIYTQPFHSVPPPRP
ncbi:hypothetical protein BDW59DRAFT_171080 [Aspergillus cavernicola]|uniref:Zn(2)-C6 fungal-type domain-containing protein n=1 Tax=Aspergillus cavernicola TaxID=176166 RepID=A0ABR4IJI7_9EURO